MSHKTKWLALALAVIILMGLLAGAVSARNSSPAAPAIANQLLKEAGIRGAGPLMRQVAWAMSNGAVFPAYDAQGRWDGKTYVQKSDATAYQKAVAGFLVSLRMDVSVTRRPVKPDDPDEKFSPKDLDNLFLWLDASAIKGLQEGDAVRTWLDLSGSGLDMEEANTNRYPVYQSGVLNNKPVVHFEAEYDVRLESTLFDPIGHPLTVFVVGSKEGGDDRGYILSTVGADHPINGAIALARDGDELSAFAGNWLSSGTSDVFAHQLITVLFDGADSEILINGVSKATGNTGNRDMTRLFIGGRGDDADFFDGDIAEVIIYDRRLATTERRQVEDYLLEKYDL